MGMVGSLKQLSDEEVERVKRSPESVNMFTEDTDVAEAVTFHNAFMIMHFGLTGRVDEVPCGPLGNAVMALEGEAVGRQSGWGYGQPRLLSPAQVVEVHHALSAFSDQLFRGRLLGTIDDISGVYRWEGTPLAEREEAYPEVEDLLEELREFYEDATESKMSVLSFIT